ncbi:MAG: NUDIX domain-containing protein [Candidatus Iainarchaeum sp.]|jgi:8-oxo-dGTP diphosphatase|nr:MAG: ADP-ribose pyrophosphatase [archaeon ADurb.Bin336]
MASNLDKNKLKSFVIVEALIYNNKGEILLLKRSNKNSVWVNKWQLPGGKVEEGESPLKAIKREICEETSLSCKGLSLFNVFKFENTFKGKKEVVSLKVYSCNISEEDLVLDADHSSFKFINPKKIKKSDLTQISKISIFGL